MTDIRPTRTEDLEGLRGVLDSTGLFPAEYLPDLFDGHLGGDGSIWLTCLTDEGVAGFCFAVPEKLTDGTWNMLAIAVHGDRQGQGLGGALVAALEASLRDTGQRILIADTSGTPNYAATRAFYRKQGYAEEARIRDFWAEGDDKIVFRKALRP